jgi:hypothetical protein
MSSISKKKEEEEEEQAGQYFKNKHPLVYFTFQVPTSSQLFQVKHTNHSR